MPMKHRREVSIHQLICKIKGPFQPFTLQNLLVGVFGVGVGVAGLFWSLRDGSFSVPWPFEQKTSSAKSLQTVAGLRNLRNSCFLNSVLQALASCSCFLPFLQNLLAIDDAESMEKLETTPLIVSLTSLLEELCLVRDEKTTLNPRRVMISLELYVRGFNLMSQQDAAEAFTHLLSSLEIEIMQHTTCLQPGGSLADITALSSRIHNLKKGAQNELKKWKNHFLGPFVGVIGSYLTCQSCSTMGSVDLQFFRSLPLSPVLDHTDEIMEGCNVLDCLKHFTKSEHIENYFCGRCWHTAALKYLSCRPEINEVRISRLCDCVKFDSCDCKNLFGHDEISWTGVSRALKRLSINRCPKTLCIHLQRATVNWQGDFIKLQGHISFPLFLDLRPFVEAARSMGDLTSVKYMQKNVSKYDGSPITLASHLHKQQEIQMLPYFHRFVSHKLSMTSLSEINFGMPCGEVLGNKLTDVIVLDNSDKTLFTKIANDEDLTESCSITETGFSEKVEISNSRSKKSYSYNLCSVIEHYGRPGSGHYAVYRRVTSQSSSGSYIKPLESMSRAWVYISDSEVKSVTEDDVLAAEASMLFYEKIETDP